MAIGPVGLGIWFLEVVLRFLLLEAEDPLLRLAIVAKPARVVVGCAQRWVTVGRGVEETRQVSSAAVEESVESVGS